jgi:succinate dehydrogenase / fumarate reductase cytochrome b subunit
MPSRVSFISSTVGTKVLIAITGLSMFLFLVGHLAGNLLLLVGPEAFNGYSHKLISNPFIYLVEAGLAAILVIHVFKAVLNWARNRSARPSAYEKKEWAGHTSRKTVASSTMIYTGVFIFVFLLLHLKTFKFGPWYETIQEGMVVRDLHRLTIEIFQSPAYVVFYVISMGLVFLHLRHGVSSAFQSLGANHPRYNRLILVGGLGVAVLLGLGFAFIPVWAFLAH